MAEDGELKIFNSAKEIARERDSKLVLWHSYAMIQCRTGKDISAPQDVSIDDTTMKYNQVQGLGSVISAQEELISTFRAHIKLASEKKWKKKFKTEEERETNEFKNFDCDYKEIRELEEILNSFRKEIINADLTPSLDDDFLVEKTDTQGKTRCELTSNFWEMLKELTDTFEKIHYILMTNKCISAGIEDDEELTYKEKEEEFTRRVTEA